MTQRNGITRKAGAPQILALYIGAAMIILAGAVLAVVSAVVGVSFPVMGNQVHGAVFGTVVAFLGIRYFISVQRLARQIDADGNQFSMKNLIPQKKTR